MTEEQTEKSPSLIGPTDRFILFVMTPQGIVAHWRAPTDPELGHIARMCEDWCSRQIKRNPSPNEVQPKPSSIVNPFGPAQQ